MTPNWHWTLQGQITLYICVCVAWVHESHILLHFALRRAVFEIQAILRQLHRMTPNWPWTQQGQIALYMYNNCPGVSNFTPFRPTTSRFQVTGHFETSAPNDENDFEHYKVKGTPHMCYNCSRVSNFTPFCSTTRRFEDTAHFIILHWLPI